MSCKNHYESQTIFKIYHQPSAQITSGKISEMVKFAAPAFERPTTQNRSNYRQISAFTDAGKRNRRVKRRVRVTRDKKWFERKRKEAAAQEKAVITALRDKDEDALQAIATAVAMAVLTI